MQSRALITGIAGQDGSYLAEWLCQHGYEVPGLIRPGSAGSTDFPRAVLDSSTVHECDLSDQNALRKVLESCQPQEVYNLAAQTFVPSGSVRPAEMAEINALGPLRLLEAIQKTNPSIRFCQAGTSELFGTVTVDPQDEDTPMRPRSLYGCAKLHAHWSTIHYREAGLFATNAILFNHESPRRRVNFVTRKITDAVARIKRGSQQSVALGNLDAERDWGYAGDYVQAMWRMLQADTAEDYVIATGERHSVREFAEVAFGHVGLDYQDHITTDPEFFRAAEKVVLRGDASKARRILDWAPTVSFKQLVGMMVEADLKRVADEN